MKVLTKESESILKTCLFTLRVKPTCAPEFVDITDLVAEAVRDSGVRNGFVVVFSKHTTAAIVINEAEPLLLVDMANFLERTSPRNAHYRHNDFDVRTVHMHENECPNGHSHCQHLSLGSSEYIPIVDCDLALGQWQRVFMVELDQGKVEQGIHREVLVQILGT